MAACEHAEQCFVSVAEHITATPDDMSVVKNCVRQFNKSPVKVCHFANNSPILTDSGHFRFKLSASSFGQSRSTLTGSEWFSAFRNPECINIRTNGVQVMILNHVVGIFTHPDDEWQTIRAEPNTITRHYLTHALILAAIPAISAFIGATHVGWTVGKSDTLYKLTSESALFLCVLFYGAMITGVVVLGKFIDFLSSTYQGEDHTPRGVALATYTTTPLFICGLIALYPVLWLAMLVGLIAVAYSVYLLYEGIPILMNIPKERGFVFASAVLTVGLVMFVALLAITVIIWATGVGPVYLIG